MIIPVEGCPSKWNGAVSCLQVLLTLVHHPSGLVVAVVPTTIFGNICKVGNTHSIMPRTRNLVMRTKSKNNWEHKLEGTLPGDQWMTALPGLGGRSHKETLRNLGRIRGQGPHVMKGKPFPEVDAKAIRRERQKARKERAKMHKEMSHQDTREATAKAAKELAADAARAARGLDQEVERKSYGSRGNSFIADTLHLTTL